RYFLEDEIDLVRKDEMRDRILQGPPFSAQEQHDILNYCEDDVRALARLLPHIVPTIRSLPQAMFRAKVNGPWRSRSGAVFQSTGQNWRASAGTGTVCRLISLPS